MCQFSPLNHLYRQLTTSLNYRFMWKNKGLLYKEADKSLSITVLVIATVIYAQILILIK